MLEKISHQNTIMDNKFKDIERSQRQTMDIIKGDMNNLNDKFDRMLEIIAKGSTTVASNEDDNSGKN